MAGHIVTVKNIPKFLEFCLLRFIMINNNFERLFNRGKCRGILVFFPGISEKRPAIYPGHHR